jgi:hypothetical protein
VKRNKLILIATLVVAAFAISTITGIQLTHGWWGSPGSINLISPVAGGTYNEQLPVNFVVSAKSGYTYIFSRIYIDGVYLDITYNTHHIETYYPDLSAGSHTIKVQAYFENSWGFLSSTYVQRSFTYQLIDNYDRILIFFHATDAVVQNELYYIENQMVSEEGFTDVYYFEDTTTWQSDLDFFDNLEGPNTLIFIYVCAHGSYSSSTQDSYTYVSASLTNPMTSSALTTKLQIFESNNIFFFIESCYSGGFSQDLGALDNVFAITTATTYQTAKAYIEKGYIPNTVGVATHYFFKGLHLGLSDAEAWSYAQTELKNWLLDHGYPLNAQTMTKSDNLETTWFG